MSTGLQAGNVLSADGTSTLLNQFLPEDSPIKDFVDGTKTIKQSLESANAAGFYLSDALAAELADAGVGLYGTPGTWAGAGPAQGAQGAGSIGAIGAGAVQGALGAYQEYMQTGNVAGALAAGVVQGGIMWGATAAFGPIGGLVAGVVLDKMTGDADPYAGMDYQDAPKFNFEYDSKTGEWKSSSGKYPGEFLSGYKDGLNLATNFGEQALAQLGLEKPDENFGIDSTGTRVTLFGTNRGDSSMGNNPYLYTSQEQESNQFADNIFNPPSKEQLFGTLNQIPYEMVYSSALKDPEMKKAIAAYEMDMTGSPTRGYGTAGVGDEFATSLQAGESNLREAAANDGQRDLKSLVDYLKNWNGDETAWNAQNTETESKYSNIIDVYQGDYNPTAGNPDWSQENEMWQMEQKYQIPEGYNSDLMINFYRRQAAMELGQYDTLFSREGEYIGPDNWLF